MAMQTEPLCEMNPTLPASPVGAHHVLLVGGHACRRIEDAHAVRPADRHAGLAAHAGDLGLQPRAVLAELGEAAVVDDGGARAAFHREPDLLRERADS